MRIGFIGCGNMGGAIIKSMASLTDEHEILIVGKSQERAKKLAELDGVEVVEILEEPRPDLGDAVLNHRV